MGVVKNLMVRAGADFSAITKQANKAKTSMSGMQSSVSKSCARMSTAVSGMNKIFSTMGVTISVAAIVAAGKSAKTAYDEQAEASAKLARVMSNTMGARKDEVKSIEDYIDAQERLGVVTGDVQTQGAQELATYLTLSSSLKTLIPVMNDMVAQQYGIGASAESAVSIATMLGKVMNGQTSALSRYGYSFTKAQEEVLKFGTEAQRAAVLAEVVGESVGGMNAALASTPNGRLQQVSNTLGKIQESFGQAVSNIAVLFVPALNVVCSVLASIATLANKVAQAFANVFGSGASNAATVVSYTAAAAAGMGDLTEETEAAGAAAKNLSTAGFDTLQKMSGSTSGSGKDVGNASVGDVGGITEMTTGTDEAGESIGWLEKGLTRLKEVVASLNFEKLTSPLQQWASDILPMLTEIGTECLKTFDTLLGEVKEIFNRIWSEAIAPALEIIQEIWNDLWDSIVDSWDEHGKPIFDRIRETFENTSDTLQRVWKTTILPIWEKIMEVVSELWKNHLKPLWDNILGFIDSLVSGALDIYNKFILPVVNWFVDLFGERISESINKLITKIGDFLGKVADVASKIIAFLTDVINFVVDVFTGDWESAFGGIADFFKKIINGMIGHVEAFCNYFVRAINKVIGAINTLSFDVPDWVPLIGGDTWGFNIPKISEVRLPRLANGAVIPPNNEFAAILGDQTSGRNIETPESLLRSIFREELGLASIMEELEAILAAIRSGKIIKMNGREVGRTSRDEMDRMARALGV